MEARNVTVLSHVIEPVSLLNYLPDLWRIIFGVLMAIISILATVENGIVLFTIFKFQVLHTTVNKILSSLALSDFLTGVCVASLFSLQLLDDSIMRYELVDMLRRYLTTAFVGASVATLAFISYDRWLHLRLLNSYRVKRRKLYCILLLCWLVPLLLPLLRKVDDSEVVYSGVIVMIVVLVLGTIAVCYVLIWMALNQRQQSTTVTMIFSRERRAAKTVLVILTIFAATIIPICLHHAMNMFKSASNDKLAKSYIVGQTLSLANSAINPVIYYYRTPDLKKHVRRVMRSRKITRIVRVISYRSKVDVQVQQNIGSSAL